MARAVWENDLPLGKMPKGEKAELPTKPVDIATNKEALVVWKRQAVHVHSANAKRVSKRFRATQTLDLAFKFQDDEAIWFPHQLDFRGRIYPLPMFLNPQGNDLAKGLLTFAVGKPITNARALGWLMIHGANTFGEDKVALAERVDWVTENEARILATAEDPIANGGWWSEADKPWMFLAFCFDYAAFQREGYGYVSSLPIMLDGSCNGLQHFAAMLRDEKGGAEVNLVPGPKPRDIYQTVADKVKAKLAPIASGARTVSLEDHQAAMRWLKFGITRKTTKRPVMIVPYSGTRFACRTHIADHVEERIEDGAEDIFSGDDVFGSTKFLANHVWDAINETVVSARQAMNWLQTAAKIVADQELPITWLTPDGFPVFQAYPELTNRRIKTSLGDGILRMSLAEEALALNKKKQANATAALLDVNQDLPAHVQVMAAACLFALLVEHLGMNVSDTLSSAYRLMRHAHRFRNQFRGIKSYLENDL